METDTPMVLMDIDGVLNAFLAQWPYGPHYRLENAGMYDVLLDTRHPAMIADLERRADIRWATMWQRNAVTDFAPIAGFGHDWPFIDFDKHNDVRTFRRTGHTVVDYKMPGIIATVGKRQPLVFIDDDMRPAHHSWAADRHATGAPTLFVQPNPSTGLTARDYRRVTAFLDRLPARWTVA